MAIRTPEGGGYGGSLAHQPRADRLDVRSLTQGHQRPIGRVVGDHGAKVHRLIDELDSGLDPAIRVQPNHEPGLIVECPVLPGKCHLHREIADDPAVREMAVVANEAIFRLAPEIRPVVGGDDQVAAEAPPMRRRIQPREGVSHTTDTTRSRSPVPDPKQMLRCALAARSLDIVTRRKRGPLTISERLGQGMAETYFEEGECHRLT